MFRIVLRSSSGRGKRLVKRPEDWPSSSYNNLALDKATIVPCPIQIDGPLLLGYRT
jgi:hypothetical protein